MTRFMLQLAPVLKELNEKLYTFHCDIKPQNICYTQNTFSLIDFGCAQCFQTKIKKGQPIPSPEYREGTYAFQSIACHDNRPYESSYDAMGLFFTLLWLYVGELPWQKLEENEAIIDHKLFLDAKIQLTVGDNLRLFISKKKPETAPHIHAFFRRCMQASQNGDYDEMIKAAHECEDVNSFSPHMKQNCCLS